MSTINDKMRRIKFIVTDVDGVLTNGLMGFDANGNHFRHFNARDGLGLALWYLTGGKAALVSGQTNKAVEAVAAQWRCTACMLKTRDKAAACKSLAEEHGIAMDELAFIGDDLIDLGAMEVVGLAVAVPDAAAEVIAAADVTTETPGGAGALREVIERILEAQGRLDEAVARYREGHMDVQ